MFLYILFVAVAFYILLPNYTINESKEKVEEVYNISINTSEKYYYNTVPISVEFNIASLLQTRRFYYFVFYKNDEQKIILVNPMTNELIMVNEEYWGTIGNQKKQIRISLQYYKSNDETKKLIEKLLK